jgi:hypothetical protein
MERPRHQTGPDSDEVPRQRCTGLARHDQTDLDSELSRAEPTKEAGLTSRRMVSSPLEGRPNRGAFSYVGILL